MKLNFADLFAGIGGFRLGLERLGWNCVYSAENDEHARQMYKENFGDDPFVDVTKLTDEDIKKVSNFDVLCAGFPCQSFSISGKKQGFMDETRGTLFFQILRFLDIKKPTAFILENVKNLIHHDHGNTFTVMIDKLNQLGYTFNYKVLNAKDFGVPQNRERIVIVGNRKDKYFDFNNLELDPVHSMNKFLDSNNNFDFLNPSEYILLPKNILKRQHSDLIFSGYRNKKLRKKGVRPNTEFLSRVHKMPDRIYSADGVNPTLSSQETSGRYFIELSDGSVRKLTINECFRFMGFPDNFKKVGTLGKLYNRIGNSVCVNMVYSIGKELENTLNSKMDVSNPTFLLEHMYNEKETKGVNAYNNLNNFQQEQIDFIVQNEKRYKGVYTVLFTSLTYKILYPKQDVRQHQATLKNGYSGRTFDTKYVTPFLKNKRFDGAMKESGWLTRSLEQHHAFDYSFPGRIGSKKIKEIFLSLLDQIEFVNSKLAKQFLLSIMFKSYKKKQSEVVIPINPVTSESSLEISDIINLLKQHFNYHNYKYGSKGNSILPVIALYSVYQILVKEMSRYRDKTLKSRESHYSSDKNSGEAGDIVVIDSNNNQYEVVEVKYGKKITPLMIDYAFDKIKYLGTVQRYYILSTEPLTSSEQKELNIKVKSIFKSSGIQIICNGLVKTLNYYLRLITNTDEFLDNYIYNLNHDPELNYEHKLSWNMIIKNNKYK